MQNPVLILGAGLLGKQALDIFNENGVLIYGFLDDDKTLHGQEIGSVSVLGATDSESFLKLLGDKTEAFIAARLASERMILAEELKSRNVQAINAIHKRASVSVETSLGHGNLIAAGVYIGPFVQIGNLNIIGSGCIIDVETKIGNYVEVGSGAVINAGVSISDGVFVGSNATLVSGIKIGKNARIGAGSVVVADVKPNETVFGNPAKEIKN